MALKQPVAQPFDVVLAHLKAQRPGGMVGIGFDAPYQSSLQGKRGLLLDAELAVDGGIGHHVGWQIFYDEAVEGEAEHLKQAQLAAKLGFLGETPGARLGKPQLLKSCFPVV